MGLQKRNLSLGGGIIQRTQPRLIDQRSEERLSNVVERAVITFRGQEHLVPVINISSRGTMIECDICRASARQSSSSSSIARVSTGSCAGSATGGSASTSAMRSFSAEQ